MPLNIYDAVERKKSVGGKKFTVINGYADISDLQFWEDNPRIYSLLDKERSENTVNKNIIFEKLRVFPDFDKLRSQIRRDEQINEPIWVCLHPRTGQYTVYEGNTRLAVAIQLSENDLPSRRASWNKIPVNVLPDGTNEKIIKRLIGLIHLVGVNQWAPFEADGYYYREVEDLRNEEKETLANACKIVSKIYGVTTSKVNKAYKLVGWMLKHKMSSNVQKEYYSYWDTIVTNGPLQKVRKVFNNASFIKDRVDKVTPDAFDKLLIKKVKAKVEVQRVSGSSDSGTTFRDDIRIISDAFNENQDSKLIFDLLNEKITIQKAVEKAKKVGIGNSEYEDIRSFAEWLCSTERMKKLQNAVIEYPDMKSQIATIIERCEIATMKLKDNQRKRAYVLETTNPNHLMYKICILMMLADKVPHEEESKKILNILASEKWLNDPDEHDIVDAIEQVSREIYKNKGVDKTANIYGKLLKKRKAQVKILKFIEEVMLADGIIRKEETALIKQLRELWNKNVT